MAIEATTVLVTGGTGFVASHLILKLLAAGYTVRTTVRSAAREPEVRETLRRAGATAPALARLHFVTADLSTNDNWSEAVQGCTYVQHVASPFPASAPESEDDLIGPARDGTLRVLRAASDDAGGTVRRVVFTSSFAAVGYGHPRDRTEPFTESDWSVLGGGEEEKEPETIVPAYQKSKTLAEKAAWEFVEKHSATTPELAVVNPTGVFGPVLGKHLSASIGLVKGLVGGSMPAAPRLYFGVVDVRDLADLLIKAMLAPEAAGQRFLAVGDGEPASILRIAEIVKAERKDKAARVPTREFPNWMLKVVALWDPKVRDMAPQLGHVRRASNAKAKKTLGWAPRPLNETIVDTVDSLYEHGLL